MNRKECDRYGTSCPPGCYTVGNTDGRQGNIMLTPTKKMIPVIILDILRKYSDEEHRLTQTDILKYIKNDYDLEVERKAVRRNIDNLIEMKYPIEYTEIPRKGKNKTGGEEENTILSELWISRDFTDGELRLLIDSLLFSHHVPHDQCIALVKKLEGLSNVYFKSYVKHIATLPDVEITNPQLFLTIEQLEKAIDDKRKVSFQYLDMGTDKKKYPKCEKDGNIRTYVVSPYQMAARDGKYYLICNYDKYEDISNYRIDRIANIEILEERAKPYKKLKGSNESEFSLGDYMSEHIYMYSGGKTRVKFRIVRPMIADVVDIFGKEVRFEEETEDHVIVRAKVTEAAMIQFAKSYAPDVVILEPESMVKEMREWAEKVKKVYGG